MGSRRLRYDAFGTVGNDYANVGQGSLPIEMHRAIKGLDATLLLEHYYSIEELEEELEYIPPIVGPHPDLVGRDSGLWTLPPGVTRYG